VFQGTEAVKLAILRSLPLILVLMVIGGIAANVVEQHAGPSYQACGRVLYSPTTLAATLTGTAPSYVDPQQRKDDALFLAQSSALFQQASTASEGAFGAHQLRSMVSANASDSSTVTFCATGKDPRTVEKAVDLVATTYRDFRASVAGAPVTAALAKVQALIKHGGTSSDSLAQLQRLKLLQALNSSDVLLVEPTHGAVKTRPAPVKDTILGVLMGIVLGLILAGLRLALDTHVRSEAEIEEILGMRVLASIPRIRKRRGLVMLGRNDSVFGDAYALLAASLSHQNGDGDSGSVVVAVTSAVEDEGKTTTAANLALALALRGSRVILVDLDFRKSSLAGTFQIPSGVPGSAQVVSGESSVAAALWTVPLDGSSAARAVPLAESGSPANGARHPASKTTHGTLGILPAGPPTAGPPTVAFDRVIKLVDELRRKAEWVVLDTPPALQTFEMEELAQHVDSVLVVVRHGIATHRMLTTFSRRTQNWSAEHMGAVFTGAPTGEAYRYGYAS
jgi:Mrp family chromosome partitioning ATPase